MTLDKINSLVFDLKAIAISKNKYSKKASLLLKEFVTADLVERSEKFISEVEKSNEKQ